MRAISTVVSIRASLEQVWSILIDTERYQDWDRTVSRVEGEMALGGQLEFFAKGEESESFRVVELSACRKMVWRRGQSLGAGATRTLLMRTVLPGLVELEIRETGAGWLAGLLSPSRDRRLQQIYKFALALKLRAEVLAAAEPVEENLDLGQANRSMSDFASPECASPAGEREDVLPTSALSITPARGGSNETTDSFSFFESTYSSTNDGLLALIAAIPPRTEAVPEVDSQGLPTTTIHIGKPIDRVKCANGRRRASHRESSLASSR